MNAKKIQHPAYKLIAILDAHSPALEHYSAADLECLSITMVKGLLHDAGLSNSIPTSLREVIGEASVARQDRCPPALPSAKDDPQDRESRPESQADNAPLNELLEAETAPLEEVKAELNRLGINYLLQTRNLQQLIGLDDGTCSPERPSSMLAPTPSNHVCSLAPSGPAAPDSGSSGRPSSRSKWLQLLPAVAATVALAAVGLQAHKLWKQDEELAVLDASVTDAKQGIGDTKESIGNLKTVVGNLQSRMEAFKTNISDAQPESSQPSAFRNDLVAMASQDAAKAAKDAAKTAVKNEATSRQYPTASRSSSSATDGSASPRRQWSIVVGAFQSEKQAQQAQQFGALVKQVAYIPNPSQQMAVKSGSIWQAQISRLTEAEAKAACAIMAGDTPCSTFQK